MARGKRRREAASPGNTQPELPTGMGYGERKAIEDAQSQIANPARADMAGPSAGPSPAGRAGPAGVNPAQVQDPFGPTNRPMESLAGAAPGGPGQELTADDILRVLYQKRPSPWLARLMRG